MSEGVERAHHALLSKACQRKEAQVIKLSNNSVFQICAPEKKHTVKDALHNVWWIFERFESYDVF